MGIKFINSREYRMMCERLSTLQAETAEQHKIIGHLTAENARLHTVNSELTSEIETLRQHSTGPGDSPKPAKRRGRKPRAADETGHG